MGISSFNRDELEKRGRGGELIGLTCAICGLIGTFLGLLVVLQVYPLLFGRLPVTLPDYAEFFGFPSIFAGLFITFVDLPASFTGLSVTFVGLPVSFTGLSVTFWDLPVISLYINLLENAMERRDMSLVLKSMYSPKLIKRLIN
ncbi:hypothetical protein ACFYKT_08855 [Cytobacillus sp. FJAT-53684]|uniref:Uncharacterized protein n=1 Tax=Cytobacillus mangrovibacter TaxID=3299024 RepID=A0ABW6JX18_9BACI